MALRERGLVMSIDDASAGLFHFASGVNVLYVYALSVVFLSAFW